MRLMTASFGFILLQCRVKSVRWSAKVPVWVPALTVCRAQGPLTIFAFIWTREGRRRDCELEIRRKILWIQTDKRTYGRTTDGQMEGSSYLKPQVRKGALKATSLPPLNMAYRRWKICREKKMNRQSQIAVSTFWFSLFLCFFHFLIFFFLYLEVGVGTGCSGIQLVQLEIRIKTS